MDDAISGVGESLSGSGDAPLDTCDDAIAFMEGLMDDYASIEEVPVAEMTAMADVATAIFTCSPDQAAFFETPEVSAFLEGTFG